jgi:ribonuclease VapC
VFLDSSAIVAILSNEPDSGQLSNAIEQWQGSFYTSPLVRFESAVSLAKKKQQHSLSGAKLDPRLIQQAAHAVDVLLADLDVEELPIDADVALAALAAAARYGKLVGHPAALNLGDCFFYASAQ